MPQSRTSNGGKDIKTVRHPDGSPDIAPADFFLHRKVKLELAGISLSHCPRTASRRAVRGSSKLLPKTHLPETFSDGWTTAKSVFESTV
jgi:hypothetical protein